MIFKVDDLGKIINGVSGEIWEKEKLASEIKKRTSYLLNNDIGENSKLILAHGGTAEFFADLFSAWNLGALVACVNPGLKTFEMNNH